MKKEIIDLASHRFVRAEEAFEDGCAMLARGSYNSAVNRFYYAAFYAARALLATKGLDSSKHSGVISLFQQHFVKTKKFADIETAKVLARSFEKRQDSDYEDFVSVTKKETDILRSEVKKFVEKCREVFTEIIN